MKITKHIIIVGMLLVSMTIAAAYTSSNGINLTDDPVTISAVDGTSTYFVITLSGITEGDIMDGSYPGWCIDRSVTMLRETSFSVRLYDSLDPANLPAAFQDDNWPEVNWILNNKDAYSMLDIQDAIWYFIDEYPWGSISSMARTIVEAANISGIGFTYETGAIIAIVLAPEPGQEGCQATFIEYYVPGREGLTPGYWKNHLDSWVIYEDDDIVGDVFGNASEFPALADDTLLMALKYHGGPGREAAARILLRSAVAAILNAAYPDINYPMTEQEIIDMVNDALRMDRHDMLDLKDILDEYNNLGAEL